MIHFHVKHFLIEEKGAQTDMSSFPPPPFMGMKGNIFSLSPSPGCLLTLLPSHCMLPFILCSAIQFSVDVRVVSEPGHFVLLNKLMIVLKEKMFKSGKAVRGDCTYRCIIHHSWKVFGVSTPSFPG